jgi:hypothetical protein
MWRPDGHPEGGHTLSLRDAVSIAQGLYRVPAPVLNSPQCCAAALRDPCAAGVTSITRVANVTGVAA